MLTLCDNGFWSILLPSLPLHNLASRHPGLTSAIASMAAEAASVAFDRHHGSPQTLLIVGPRGELRVDLTWAPVDNRMKRAWNNSVSRTENGAVAVAIAAIELALGLVVVLRAETGSGVDYYLAEADRGIGNPDEWLRLEISGTDEGDGQTLGRRLKEKCRQARQGRSDLPAIACVVGFRQLETRHVYV